MSRLVFYAVVTAFAVWLFFALRTNGSGADVPTTTDVSPPGTTTVESTIDGLDVTAWHRRAVGYRARARGLTRALRFDPETSTAIRLACVVYPAAGCAWLWRVSWCESRRNRYSVSSDAADGLYQFLVSTWARTPFRSLNVFDPYANALAAGWLATHGGRGQWVCQ